jgi:hypothetical protein
VLRTTPTVTRGLRRSAGSGNEPAANLKYYFPPDWRAYGRAPASFGLLEPNLSGLENRFGGDSSDEGSNPSPSVVPKAKVPRLQAKLSRFAFSRGFWWRHVETVA